MIINFDDLLRNYSSNTKRNYISITKNFFENKKVGEITVADFTEIKVQEVEAWIEKLKKQGIAQKTINTKITGLSTLCKLISNNYNCPVNSAFDGLRKNTSDTKDTRFTQSVLLEDWEIEKLKDTTNLSSDNLIELRDSIIINLLIQTGLKRSNICNILVSDVHETSIDVYDKNEIFEFHISNELIIAIRKYINMRGISYNDEVPLLISHSSNSTDTLLNATTIYRTVKNYAIKAGLNIERVKAENIHKYVDYKKATMPLINFEIINRINEKIYFVFNTDNMNYSAYRDVMLLCLLVNYGLSDVELCGIDICDVDLKSNTIKILTGERKRIINLEENHKQYLQKYLIYRNNIDSNKKLFVSLPNYNELDHTSIRRIIYRLLERFELPVITPSEFRLDYIRRVYSDSKNVKNIKEITGHKSDVVFVNTIRKKYR